MIVCLFVLNVMLEIHAEIFRLNDKIPRTASEQSTLNEWEIQMKQD